MRRQLWVALCLALGSTAAHGQINVEQVMSIGRNAIYFNDYVVSIGYFNQVIGLRPWMAEPYLYRSIAKISLDDYEGARLDANEALSRNPFLSKAYLVRGIANFNLKEVESAIKDYQEGVRLAPNDLGMRYNLAVALYESKQYPEATTTAEDLLRFSSKYLEAHQLLASIALSQSDTTKALNRTTQTLSIDSTYAPAHLLRAQIYAERNEYPTAEREISLALEQGQDRPDLYVNRGIMRFHQSNLRGAMADYTSALLLDPSYRVALNNRALLRLRVGEYQGALEDWNSLLKLEPDNYLARYNRVLLRQRLGQLRPALEDLNIVLKQYPSFAEGFSRRVELRQALGDAVGADRDRLHLYDLQNNKTYRANALKTAQRNSSATRGETDKAIENYAMLVETKPESGHSRQEYSSKVRGRIQNQNVAIQPKGFFFLTYYEHLDQNRPNMSMYYAQILDEFNRQSRWSHRLLVQQELNPITQEQVTELQADLLQASEGQTATHYLRRAIDYALLQNAEDAIRDFSKAIELDPRQPLAYFGRAITRLKQQEAQRNDLETDNQQGETASKLIRGVQDKPILERTITQYDPLSDLNEVIRLAPKFAYAYYNRGLLQTNLGQTDKAIKDYDEALKLNSRFAEAYYNRGLLLLSVGKTKEGTADLSKAGELGIYQAYNIIKRVNK